MPTLLPEQSITPAGQPTLMLPPPQDTFTRRKERLAHLAKDHSLGPWLNHLASLSAAQQNALDVLLAAPLDWLDLTAATLTSTSPDVLAKVAAIYKHLATTASLQSPDTPAPALSQDELQLAVARCLLQAQAQASGAGRDLTDLMVAAAMQVVWTAIAQHALPAAPKPTHSEFCPVCASAAVGSIVLAGEGKGGLRYQQCCLCSTRWNVVRAHCTLCAEGSTVHYLSLEGQNQAIGAETCDHCHGYAKIFFQDKDPQVDPVADDVATLALDVLVGEDGFGRAAPNLFLCEGEAS
jgi:FdhE protein